MLQPRNRELADPEIPFGVTGPLDVEIVAIVEWQLEPLAFELVGDDAVVDPPDLRAAAVASVEELCPSRVISPASTARTPQSCSVITKSGRVF